MFKKKIKMVRQPSRVDLPKIMDEQRCVNAASVVMQTIGYLEAEDIGGIKRALDYVEANQDEGVIGPYQAGSLRDKIGEIEDARLDDDTNLLHYRFRDLFKYMLDNYCGCLDGTDEDSRHRPSREETAERFRQASRGCIEREMEKGERWKSAADKCKGAS